MYLGAVDAIAHRLLGGEPAAAPPHYSHSVKDDAPVGSVKLRRGLHGSTSETMAVPVYYFDYVGHPFKYPAFAVECIDIQPRRANFLAKEEYYAPLPGENITLTDRSTGTTHTGPALAVRRPVEFPYDFMVEVRAYADNPAESASMVEWISRHLPPTTYLTVPQKDGTTRKWDVEQIGFKDLDKRDAVRQSPGLTREYVKVWTFRVEGYSDTTDLAVLETTGRGRIISVENKESP